MSDFFLKRFEIGGLNCFLTDVFMGGTTRNLLSKVLLSISRCDKRFSFETTGVLSDQQDYSTSKLRQFSPEIGNSRVFSRLSSAHTPPIPGAKRFNCEWQSELPIRKLKRITWNDPMEQSSLLSVLWNCETPNQLEANQLEANDDVSGQEFRYSIMDAQGRLIESSLDSMRPIFSERGPVVESGSAIRIDLVSVSAGYTRHLPVLARRAQRKSKRVNDCVFRFN